MSSRDQILFRTGPDSSEQAARSQHSGSAACQHESQCRRCVFLADAHMVGDWVKGTGMAVCFWSTLMGGGAG